MKYPNILFIQVDQLSAQSLSAYGGQIAVTPTIDHLAQTGVVFENAYCNFPLCAPSRFSMAAGQLCSAIDAFDNAAEFAAEIPTYAHHLRHLGYQTSLSGKMHFVGPDQYHGFERRLTADLYPADFSWVPRWHDEGERDTNGPSSVTVSGVCENSIQLDFDELVATEAIRHLHELHDANDKRPFFMQVSFTHPHEPYLCQQTFWDLYSDDAVALPTVPPLSESEHDAHSIRLLKDFGMFDVPFSEADILRARRAYYGSVSYVDSLVTRLLAALKDTHVDKNTVVVFTSDHGDMLGERGLWFKKHFFQPSLAIPLIVTAPWINSQRVTELVSLVDLLPTFNGLALDQSFDSTDHRLEGIDLTTLLDKGNPTSERAVYAEYLAEAALAPIFMIRRGTHKFILSSQDQPLLFDLDSDPDERRNLALDPVYQSLVRSFENEVNEKWNQEALTERILESQARRAFVLRAMKQGQGVRWNHDETPTDEVPWYRGVGGYNTWAFDYTPGK